MGHRSQMECETLIRWDRTSEPAVLETFDATVARRWGKAGIPVVEKDPGRWYARVPVGELRITLRRKREMTPEQRADAKARLEGARKVKNSQSLCGPFE